MEADDAKRAAKRMGLTLPSNRLIELLTAIEQYPEAFHKGFQAVVMDRLPDHFDESGRLKEPRL